MLTANLLEGERVRLAALTEDDLPAVAAWYDDSAFGRLFDMLPAGPRRTDEFKDWIEATKKGSTFLFGVRKKADDALIGLIELDDIIWPHRCGWLGIGFGRRKDWGKGYGTDAGRLALGFAFRELNLHRLCATVFDYNAASRALLEKLGFTHEGTFREHLERDGQRHDMLLYGLLRPEWQAGQGRDA
jgi:RimJ/RimL family protein N-acetyltransferase